LLRKIVVVNYF